MPIGQKSYRANGSVRRVFAARERDAIVRCLREAGAGDREVEGALAVDGDNDVAVFTISNGRVDTYNSTLAPRGAILDDFANNPVVLFGHNQDAPPVAKDISRFANDDAVIGTAMFMPRDMSEFGHSIGRMVRAGFLNAASIGFDPVEMVEATDRASEPSAFPPVDFTRWRLLEWSIVPVPANADCLAQERTGLTSAETRKLLGEMIERGFIVGVTRQYIESIRRDIGASTVVTTAKESTVAAPKPVEGIRENPPAIPEEEETPLAPDVTGASREADVDPEEDRAPPKMQCPECGHQGEAADFAAGEGEESADAEDEEPEEEMLSASEVARKIAEVAVRAAKQAREDLLRELGRLD